jgi:hypothetical protein
MKLFEEFKLVENMWKDTVILTETWGFLTTPQGLRAKEQLDAYDDSGVNRLRDYINELKSFVTTIVPSPLTTAKIRSIKSKINNLTVDLHWLEDYMEENDLEARIAEFRELHMDESIGKKHNIATETTINEQINLKETNKMTKNELRQMIREMLHEELKLVESKQPDIKTLLTNAKENGGNVLIKSAPGAGTINSLRIWAKENNLKLHSFSAKTLLDAEVKPSSLAGGVVLLDGLDRANPKDFDKVFDLVQLIAKSAAFVIAVADDTAVLTSELGNRFFKYKV